MKERAGPSETANVRTYEAVDTRAVFFASGQRRIAIVLEDILHERRNGS